LNTADNRQGSEVSVSTVRPCLSELW